MLWDLCGLLPQSHGQLESCLIFGLECLNLTGTTTSHFRHLLCFILEKALEEAFHHDGHGDDSSGMETAGPKGLDERTLTLL